MGPDDLSPEDEGSLYEQAYEEKGDSKADTGGCSGVRVPDQYGFDRRIALTFDDGPATTTPEVLAILREHNAPATFFTNGNRYNSTTRPIAEEIVADPLFTLGNHTWSHPNMAELGESSAASQIDRTTEVIEAAGGEPTFFRFPYGSSTCTTAAMVRNRGYHVTGWHIDSADWCYAAGGGYCSPSTFRYVPDSLRDDMIGYVLSQARQQNGGIILFHDIHRNTVNNLDRILDALSADGFTFTSLDDVDTFPLLNGLTPEPGGFIGDPCEGDDDCRFSGAFCLPSEEISGGYCTKACTSTCPDREGYPTTRCVAAPDGYGSTSNLCTIGCGPGADCRDGLSCQTLGSPTGYDREVCWN